MRLTVLRVPVEARGCQLLITYEGNKRRRISQSGLTTEEKRLLRDDGKTSSQRSETESRDIDVVDRDLSFVEFDKTEQGSHDTRFCEQKDRFESVEVI